MRIALVIAVLICAATAQAQQSATLSMSADRTQVAVGETFELTIRAELQGGEAEEIKLPNLEDFAMLSQRVARPMQFRFGFGNQTQVVQSTMVYEMTLQATHEGRFELHAPSVTMGGRAYEGNALTIVVGAGPPGGVGQLPSQPTSGMPNGATPPSGPLDGATFDPDAFVRTVVDKHEAFVGEQVTVTVYYYTRAPIHASPNITREPQADGFWVHDLLPQSRTLESVSQGVNGVPFRVYVIRRFAAFPLHEGELTIGPLGIQVPPDSFFSLFGGSGGATTREGVPITVRGKPLPERGRPSGPVAIGQYAIEAVLDRTEARTGDAVKLTARLTGTGNVRDVELTLPPIDGIRVLAPTVHDEIRSPNDAVEGTRTYEWLLVPERPGLFALPALRIATFDPSTERYGTAEGPTLTLTAAGSPIAQDEQTPDATTADGTVAEPGDAPHFGVVRTESELSRGSWRFADSRWFSVLLGLPPLFYLGLLAFTSVRKARLVPRPDRENKEKRKHAKKRLALAEERAKQNDARGFYTEIATALRSALEARLGTPVLGMTHAALRAELLTRGMTEELVARVTDELEGTDFARFSATGVAATEMEQCLGRTRALLDRIDRFAQPEAPS